MQQIYISSYFRGYNRFMKYVYNVADHPQKKVIEERLKIIKFFDEFGSKATKEAFHRCRSTIYLWKQNLNYNQGKLSALAPESKAPQKKRQKERPRHIVQFIEDYRVEHPGVGKETITPELDEYCLGSNLNSVSESTVGRIISELKEKGRIPRSNIKVSFYARTGNIFIRQIKKRFKLRRKGYQPKEPGDLWQMDSITIFHHGIKRYFITAIELKTNFAFAHGYKSLNSENAADFFKKLKSVSPFKIARIQTDNGSEFAKVFRRLINKLKIIHFHNYPRHPQSNPNIERFNRTIQEQHINWHKEELADLDQFNENLMEYLIWYNTKKAHRALNKLSPLRYYIDTYVFDLKKSNMLWTLTKK